MSFPAIDVFEYYKVDELIEREYGRVEANRDLAIEYKKRLDNIIQLERQFFDANGQLVGILRVYEDSIREIFRQAKGK